MKPSKQFLEHIIDDPEKIFLDVITKEMNRRKGKRPVSYYFKLLNEINKDDNEDDVFGENDDDGDDDDEYDNKDKLEYKKIFTCMLDDDDNDHGDNKSIDINDSDDVVIFKSKSNKSGKKKKDTAPKKNNQKKKVNKTKKKIELTNSLFDDNKGGFILEI